MKITLKTGDEHKKASKNIWKPLRWHRAYYPVEPVSRFRRGSYVTTIRAGRAHGLPGASDVRGG